MHEHACLRLTFLRPPHGGRRLHARAGREALAEEQSKLIDERLATKLDIEELRLATKLNIEQLRKDIKIDMRELEVRMVLKLGTIVTAIVAMFSALTHFWR